MRICETEAQRSVWRSLHSACLFRFLFLVRERDPSLDWDDAPSPPSALPPRPSEIYTKPFSAPPQACPRLLALFCPPRQALSRLPLRHSGRRACRVPEFPSTQLGQLSVCQSSCRLPRFSGSCRPNVPEYFAEPFFPSLLPFIPTSATR